MTRLTEKPEPAPSRPWGSLSNQRGQRRKARKPLVQVNLNLTEEQLTWLDAKAVQFQQSRSDVARAVFQATMKNEAKKKARKERRKTEDGGRKGDK